MCGPRRKTEDERVPPLESEIKAVGVPGDKDKIEMP